MGKSLFGRARVGVGLTQAAVAEALGVSQQTVARWETGQTPPSRYLRELSDLLELPVAGLLEQPSRKSRPRSQQLELSQVGAVPFGTARIDLVTLPEDEWQTASERAAATEWTAYEYPISEQTRASLAAQLGRRDAGAVGWLWFASLDNRIVFANLDLVEAVALISNRIEDMPSYQPPHIYEAILTPELQPRLAAASAGTAAAPVDDLVSACRSYLDEAGGLEAAIAREREIVIETARGYRDTLPLDSDQIAANNIEALLLALTDPATHRSTTAPIQDWLLNLHADGPDRATFYRVGALALIDAPATAITTIQPTDR